MIIIIIISRPPPEDKQWTHIGLGAKNLLKYQRKRTQWHQCSISVAILGAEKQQRMNTIAFRTKVAT